MQHWVEDNWRVSVHCVHSFGLIQPIYCNISKLPNFGFACLLPSQQEMMLVASAVLLCLSLLVLIYACYIERLLFLQSQLRAARLGYTSVPDSVL